MTCEVSGKIENIPVRTLLKWIRHSSRTGILVLDETDASGAIEFLDGEIVSARTGAGFTDIGTILLENKVINAELLKQATDRQRRASGGGTRARIGSADLRRSGLARLKRRPR